MRDGIGSLRSGAFCRLPQLRCRLGVIVENRIVVLGLGNLLLGDEGLGTRALERLIDHYDVPPEVTLVDGGVLGLELLSYIEDATHLLVLDAVQSGNAPGTLVCLDGRQVQAALAVKLSMHQLSFQEVLAMSALRGITPRYSVVCGLEPMPLEVGLDLSDPVRQALPVLVEAAVSRLCEWGVALQPKRVDTKEAATRPQFGWRIETATPTDDRPGGE